MKPKNKFQRACVEASKKLPPLTDAQVQWAYSKLIEPVGRRTPNGQVYCLDCGEVFYNDTKRKHCTCPNCRTTLYIEDTRKQKFSQKMYATYITACEGLQVIRVFMVDYYAKVGTAPRYSHTEVMQRWIAPSGKYCTLARNRVWGTMYYDSWIYSSDLELHNETWVYDRIDTSDIYPRVRLIPELKRTGYKKGLYGQSPTELFRILLTDNRAESLLKMGQDELLRLYPGDWAQWSENEWSDCRDPVVLQDGDTFYCYYTARKKEPSEACIGVASSKDLMHWKDEGYIRFENSLDTPPESPYAFKREGRYYLIYTSYKDGTVYSTSDHPLKGWKQIDGREASLIRNVSASEIYKTSDGAWYLSLITHPDGLHLLEMRRLLWNESEKPEVVPMERTF